MPAGTALAHTPAAGLVGRWPGRRRTEFCEYGTQQGETRCFSNLKRREGFTLIELMIVVAIIGILAAIAIPNFIKFQLRSKAGEGKVNLAAIRTAEESYFAEAGTYLDWTGRRRRPFRPGEDSRSRRLRRSARPAARLAHRSPGFCWIGWQPEGDVYYSYEAFTGVGGTPTPADMTTAPPTTANEFYAGGVADIDADFPSVGVIGLNSWGINQPDITGTFMTTPGWTNQCQCGVKRSGWIIKKHAFLSMHCLCMLH